MRSPALLYLTGVLLCAFACGPGASGRRMASEVGARADVPLLRAPYDAWTIDPCGDVGTSESDTGVLRAPYLQQVTDDAARVTWTARTAADYSVELRRPGGSLWVHPSQIDPTRLLQDAVQRSVQLTNLAPETVYCYELQRADGSRAAAGAFRTAPEAGTGARVSFVAFGDSGEGGSDQQAVIDQLKRVPMDFALVTGDVAYPSGSLDSYERNHFGMYGAVLASVPVFPITGNHDYGTDDAAPFREVFSLPENGGPEGLERWYSFDWGDVHIVALDTERVGPVQAAWLDADLAANELPWTIVMLHKSPYASGEHGSNEDVRAVFAPIFEKHRVPLVLAGHDHNYERTQAIESVTYVVTGGGGRGTRPVGASTFTAFSEDVLHFVHVTIERDDLRLYAIDATGQEFDFLRLRRAS